MSIVQEQQHIQEYSKNSLAAKSGYKAEDIFRTDELIKYKLEKYFGKKIIHIDKIHGKNMIHKFILKIVIL